MFTLFPSCLSSLAVFLNLNLYFLSCKFTFYDDFCAFCFVLSKNIFSSFLHFLYLIVFLLIFCLTHQFSTALHRNFSLRILSFSWIFILSTNTSSLGFRYSFFSSSLYLLINSLLSRLLFLSSAIFAALLFCQLFHCS